MEMEVEYPQHALPVRAQPEVRHDSIKTVNSYANARSSGFKNNEVKGQGSTPSQSSSKDPVANDPKTLPNTHGHSGPNPAVSWSGFDKTTKLASLSIFNRRDRFNNPEEFTGSLLITLNDTQFWTLKGPARELSATLQKEVEDCLSHANLGKRVYVSHYMHGKSKKKASPVVILWGADKLTRRKAKERLKEEQVLEQQKYGGWCIRMCQEDPIFEGIRRLMDDMSTVAGYDQFDSEDLTFWKILDTGGHIVLNLKSSKNAIGTICGPIVISEQSFYLTSAHVLTGTSPFDEISTQGNRTTALSENLFDSSDDEEEHEGPASRIQESILPSAVDFDISISESNEQQNIDQAEHQNDVRGLSLDNKRVVKLAWPAPKILVRLGSPNLDYGLIQVASGAFSDEENSSFVGFEWHLSNETEFLPPTGKILIRTADRNILHGTFLSTAVSYCSPGKSDAQYLWTYWPDCHSSEEGDKSSNKIRQGDSGAWVFGGNKFYGYVVAGSPTTGAAFVVPSIALYRDISDKFGKPGFLERPLTARKDHSSVEDLPQLTYGRATSVDDDPRSLGKLDDIPPRASETSWTSDGKSLSDSPVIIEKVGGNDTALPNTSGIFFSGIESNNVSGAAPIMNQCDSQDDAAFAQAIKSSPSHVESEDQYPDFDVEDRHMTKNILDKIYRDSSSKGAIKSVMSLLQRGIDLSVKMDFYDNLLQAASSKGQIEIIRQLLDMGVDVNTRGGFYGNALQAASSEGRLAVAKLLLDRGANIDAKGGYFRDALCAASSQGDLAIVRLLLDNGVDVTTSVNHYGNALQAASAKGHLAVTILLLGNGVDVNTKGGYYDNALQAASAKGYLDVVKLLLEKGADPDARGGRYHTALQAASAQGHSEVVKLFLEKGVKVDARESSFQAASAQGHLDIVKLLLEKDADPDTRGGHYHTALQAASAQGHLDVVKLFLENGADPYARGGRYHTALQAASARGHLEVVMLLLEKHADLDARESSLQAASTQGHLDVVKLLLENGASPDAKGGRYYTVLQAASAKGHSEVVRLLLENGASPNTRGGRYHTALQAASAKGHLEVVKLLLEKAADPEHYLGGGRYHTALQAASAKGHLEVVKLLLEEGADPEHYPGGGRYHTALQAASAQGHLEVVRLLLEKVTGPDAKGSSLEAASVGGHLEVVRLLLEKGADANAMGGFLGKAYQAASAGNQMEVADLLLNNGAQASSEGTKSESTSHRTAGEKRKATHHLTEDLLAKQRFK